MACVHSLIPFTSGELHNRAPGRDSRGNVTGYLGSLLGVGSVSKTSKHGETARGGLHKGRPGLRFEEKPRNCRYGEQTDLHLRIR